MFSLIFGISKREKPVQLRANSERLWLIRQGSGGERGGGGGGGGGSLKIPPTLIASADRIITSRLLATGYL